jgi:hypothetical protein
MGLCTPKLPLKLVARYVSKDVGALPANFAFTDGGNFTYELQYKDGSIYQAPITVKTNGEWDEPLVANNTQFDPDKGLKCLIYANSKGGQGCSNQSNTSKTLGGHINIDGVDSIQSLMKEFDASTAVVEYVRAPKPVYEDVTLGDGSVEQRAKTSANYNSRLLRYSSAAACSNKTFLNSGSWGALLQATTERVALTSPTADYLRVGAPWETQYTSPGNSFNVSASTTETKPQLDNKAVPYYGSPAEMFVVNKSELVGTITGFARIKQETQDGLFNISNVVPGGFSVTVPGKPTSACLNWNYCINDPPPTTANYSAPVITASDSGTTRNVLATYSNIPAPNISTLSYNVSIPCQGVSSAYINLNSAETAQLIAVNGKWVGVSPRAFINVPIAQSYEYWCGRFNNKKCWGTRYINNYLYGQKVLDLLASGYGPQDVGVDTGQPASSSTIIDISSYLVGGDNTISMTTISNGATAKSGSLNTVFVPNE